MKKIVLKDLLDQQVLVLKVISYVISICFLIIAAFMYSSLNDSELSVILGFLVAAVLFNVMFLRFHANVFAAYMILIVMVYLIALSFVCFTGGIVSPAIYLVATIPLGAYNTSKKQGLIWVGISGLTVVLIGFADTFNIPIYNVIPQEYTITFHLIIAFFVLAVITSYAAILKKTSFNAFKSYMNASEELSEKRGRLDNLVKLVNHTQLLMCVIDLNSLVFLEVNPYFKLELGYELAELRERKLTDVIRKETLPTELKYARDTLKEGHRFSFVAVLKCRNTTEKSYELNGILKDGKIFMNGWDINTPGQSTQ